MAASTQIFSQPFNSEGIFELVSKLPTNKKKQPFRYEYRACKNKKYNFDYTFILYEDLNFKESVYCFAKCLLSPKMDLATKYKGRELCFARILLIALGNYKDSPILLAKANLAREELKDFYEAKKKLIKQFQLSAEMAAQIVIDRLLNELVQYQQRLQSLVAENNPNRNSEIEELKGEIQNLTAELQSEIQKQKGVKEPANNQVQEMKSAEELAGEEVEAICKIRQELTKDLKIPEDLSEEDKSSINAYLQEWADIQYKLNRLPKDENLFPKTLEDPNFKIRCELYHRMFEIKDWIMKKVKKENCVTSVLSDKDKRCSHGLAFGMYAPALEELAMEERRLDEVVRQQEDAENKSQTPKKDDSSSPTFQSAKSPYIARNNFQPVPALESTPAATTNSNRNKSPANRMNSSRRGSVRGALL